MSYDIGVDSRYEGVLYSSYVVEDFDIQIFLHISFVLCASRMSVFDKLC